MRDIAASSSQVFSILGLAQGVLAFGIVGLLAIIPGSYQGFVLLQTWRGVSDGVLRHFAELRNNTAWCRCEAIDWKNTTRR